MKFSTRFPDMTGTLAGTELAALTSEYGRLMDETRRIRAERDDLARSGEREARAADADALARSMRSGGKDPGEPNLVKFHARLADLERRLEGTTRALALVQADISALLDERAPSYLADAATLHATAKTRLADAIAAVQEAATDEARLRSVMAWLDGSGKMAPTLTVNIGGTAVSLTAVLSALTDAATA